MGSLILISLKRSLAQTPILGLLRMLEDVRMMSPMTTAQLGTTSRPWETRVAVSYFQLKSQKMTCRWNNVIFDLSSNQTLNIQHGELCTSKEQLNCTQRILEMNLSANCLRTVSILMCLLMTCNIFLYPSSGLALGWCFPVLSSMRRTERLRNALLPPLTDTKNTRRCFA